MSFWMIILLVGLVFLVFGLLAFFNNMQSFKSRRPILLVGIFLPIFLAYSYADIFTKNFAPSFTIIDLGALLILGMFSGIFIASYFFITRI